jgi:hypothetical protein
MKELYRALAVSRLAVITGSSKMRIANKSPPLLQEKPFKE